MFTSIVLLALLAQKQPDTLAAGFRTPPLSARPQTWWHWMNGNVTREGITADLEAMKDAGIGGAQMFTVDQGIPAGPAKYMGPKWRALTAYAVREASRLGLQLCIHNCAGWSSSGGPWIKPEDGMQVIAWSETQVEGPKAFSGVLPLPKAPQVYRPVPYYRDIAVYAFKSPDTTPSRPADFLARTGVVRGDGIEPNISDGEGIPKGQIVNLTAHLSSDGQLEWDVPPGRWTILRMGHVPTGIDNHPAPPEGDGLEVDKLSRNALDHHWAGMMAKVLKDAGPLAGKSLNNSLIDSYEVGSQNWTPKFREDFRRLRGYDPIPYLPAIAGFTVDSKPVTERFLWDVRRTIADLFAENYYGYFAELCHKAGLKFSTEPYGDGGFDNIQSGSTADIPMGEFWLSGSAMETTKLASSVGHVYGRPIIGAESFTADESSGRWIEEPYTIKAVGDRAFCEGINRYIFHRYAMQPWVDVKPGMTMGPWGTHFDRTETWWNEAKEWLRYVARCQFLLQRGRFVADACYFYGESAPADLPGRDGLRPMLPAGYDYDGCDAAAMRRMTVRNGRVTLPSGMSYAVLVLPESKFMTPEMASKVRDLVRAGATVVGPKPIYTPSLSGFPASEQRLAQIAGDVWGHGEPGMHRYGRGRVAVGVPLGKVLTSQGLTPDVGYVASGAAASMMDIHRHIDGADVYFVSNQRYSPVAAKCTFRVKGEVPELWRPDTGSIETAPAYSGTRSGTALDLHLGPAGSVFVVFRKKAPRAHLTVFQPRIATSTSARGPEIRIVKAFYGSTDGRGADVTDKVRKLVSQGQVEVPATNGVFGDPVVNVPKQLTINYTVGGKSKTIHVPENGSAELLPAAPIAAPSYELNARPNGAVEVISWKRGSYSYARSKGATGTISVRDAARSLDLSRGWDLSFPPNLGATPRAHFDALISWPEDSNPGIKYFSGSATYTRAFEVPAGFASSGRAVRLDLGAVKNFATVEVNGRRVATLWKPPFVLDVSRLVHAGRNRITVKVTNLWPNRIIGDEHLPPEVQWRGNHMEHWPAWLTPGKARIQADRPKTGRVTFETWHYYDKSSPLLPSGLLGPVRLESARRIVLTLGGRSGG